MPYCHPDQKTELNAGRAAVTEGELTYKLQQVVQEFLLVRHEFAGEVRYSDCAQVLGAIEGLRHDFVDRVLLPYEATKAAENGDVWDSRLIATNR